MFRGFKDLWYSMTSPEKYRDFMNYKLRRLFLHTALIVLISMFVTMAGPVIEFFSYGGVEGAIDKGLPEFYVSSEEGLWMERPLKMDEYDVFVDVDSNVVKEDISDINGAYGSYENVIIADKEKLYIKTVGEQELIIRYDEQEDFRFSKADLKNWIPMMYLSFVLVFLLLFLVDFCNYMIIALVISWIGALIAAFMGMRLGGKRLYRMAIFAGTTSFFLEMLQNVTGKTIPNFSFFSIVITLGYLYFAIKDYKENGSEDLPPVGFENKGE